MATTQNDFRTDLIEWIRQLKKPAPWNGLSAVEWAQRFSPELAEELLAARHPELGIRLNREELQLFCKRKDVRLAYRVAAVMAWGRSNSWNRQHNRKLWASIPRIQALLENLPSLTRRQAFAQFRHLVAKRELQGMRASFYTKVMFFFGCPGAYILDQWMAKGILALSTVNWCTDTNGKPVFAQTSGNFVRIGYGGTSIHLDMSDENYEQYCLALESMVAPLGRTDGADVEFWLFSDPTSEWRRFLKKLDWRSKAATVQSIRTS